MFTYVEFNANITEQMDMSHTKALLKTSGKLIILQRVRINLVFLCHHYVIRSYLKGKLSEYICLGLIGLIKRRRHHVKAPCYLLNVPFLNKLLKVTFAVRKKGSRFLLFTFQNKMYNRCGIGKVDL